VGQKLFIPSNSTEGYATPTPVGMVQLATPDADGKVVHEVQPYQALIMIAQAYNVTVDTILALNGLQVDWPLQIGQKLLINAENVTPSSTPRPLSAIEKLTPASDGNYYHTVQSGEYLAYIANLYEVSLTELLGWNGMTSSAIIQPGQNLLLRVTPPATATVTPAPPSAIPTSTQTPLVPTTTQLLAPTNTITPADTNDEQQPGATRIIVPVVIVLALAGLIIFGWALLKGKNITSENDTT
jgi:LysM repeat protein